MRMYVKNLSTRFSMFFTWQTMRSRPVIYLFSTENNSSSPRFSVLYTGDRHTTSLSWFSTFCTNTTYPSRFSNVYTCHLGTRFVFHDFALGIIRPTHVYRYFALRTYVTDLQRFALNRKYMCPSRFTMFTMSIKCRHRVFNCFAVGLKRLRRNFSVLQFT